MHLQQGRDYKRGERGKAFLDCNLSFERGVHEVGGGTFQAAMKQISRKEVLPKALLLAVSSTPRILAISSMGRTPKYTSQAQILPWV